MHLKKIFLLALILLAKIVSAQSGRVDSLQAVFKTHSHDTIGVETLIHLAEEVYFSDPAQAETYCRKANSLSQELRFDNGLAVSCGWIAYLLEQRGQVDSALAFYRKGLEIAKRTGNKKDQGQILNNIAAIYKDEGKTELALENYRLSIALHNAIGNTAGISSGLNNIGLIYQNQGQLLTALDYYKRALEIDDSLGSKEGVAVAYHNIGSVYKDIGEYEDALGYYRKSLAIEQKLKDKYNEAYTCNAIGNIYFEQKKFGEALAEYEKALAIREEIEDKKGMAYSLRSIGTVQENTGEKQKAIANYRRSLALFREVDSEWGASTVLYSMGNIYFSQGNTDSASICGLEAYQLAKNLGYPVDLRNAAELMQKIYRSQGHYEQALEMYDVFVQMNDSVRNDQTRKSAMKSKYEHDFNELESAIRAEQARTNALADEQSKRETVIRYFLIGGAVLLLLMVVLLYNRYKIKNRTNLELEMKSQVISGEKNRSDALLLNILPAEVAYELKETGSAAARSYEHVTVMFTDFKDFTKVSEQLGPEELVAEINHCFSAFDAIISKYMIEKIKTVGDAYICVSGLPVVFPDHAATVVNAALEIRDFMQQYYEEREAAGRPAFRIRIGINTGPVVAGIVGTQKFAYDIWGDTVNLAARMESNCEPGKVNISSGTHALVKDAFECEHRGKIEAKNKGFVDMYFVEKK